MITMNDHGPAFQEPSAHEVPKATMDVPPHLLGRMRQQFRDNGIPDTPDNREKFLEAEDVREMLEELGVQPERVAATADGKGHVRLDFAAVHKLVELIEPGSTGVDYTSGIED